MQHIKPSFESATYVIDLNALMNRPWPANVKARWVRPKDADNILNEITSDFVKGDRLNQVAVHGDQFERYSVQFYRSCGRKPPLSECFYLKDFLFPDRTVGEARHVDDLMRMLDRDRLGAAMREVLVSKFKLEQNPDAPLFWRMDIRRCSHPDYRRLPPPGAILLLSPHAA